MRAVRRVAGIACLLLILGSCGGAEAAPIMVIANSPGTLVPGEVRLLIGLLDAEGNPLSDSELAATLELYDPLTGELATSTPAEFLWTIPDVRGLYVARVQVDRPGVWGVALAVSGMTTPEPVGVDVAAAAILPVVGDVAPASITPTAAEFDLRDISSDPTPNPRFYEQSLSDALDSGTPVVAVFSTPAFCASATCGPTLDVVDEVAAQFGDVEFIHIEVYINLDAASFDELELAPAVSEWGLPSEPWVFVIGGDGVVSAAFEGALGTEELTEAIEASAG